MPTSMPGSRPDHPGPRRTRISAAFLPGGGVPRMSAMTSIPLTPGRWTLDPNHSSVGFSIRHLGVSKVRGRFTDFTLDVAVGATAGDTHVNASIDVASIDTGNPDRDAHVLSPDILDVSRR